MADRDGRPRDSTDLALAAAKVALRGVAGARGKTEGEPERTSWQKRLVSGALGLLAAFYLVNSFIGIVPLLDKLHYLFALGIIWWSLSVWGIRPIKALKDRRERKRLAAGETEPGAP